MSASRQIIAALIAGGMEDIDAMALVAQSAVEMVPKVSGGSTPGAVRMSDYRDRREAMGLPRIFQAEEYRPLLLARDGARCIYCEATERLVIDHIHPIILGGNDDVGNLGFACRPCNGRKAGRPFEDHDMNIVVDTALSAHEDYKSRTLFTPPSGEHCSPKPRTPAHNGAHVHPPQNTPLSTSKNLKSRERQNRGTRIAADWSPCDAGRAFAKQEGFSDFEIGRETNKFRDHWIAEAGSKGVKLDWPATWRKWVRRSAEWAGKAPPSGSNASTSLPDSYYAKPESEQLAAWDAFGIRTTGKGMPRDKNQGWRVKSEWPPGHGTLPLAHPTDAYQEAE